MTPESSMNAAAGFGRLQRLFQSNWAVLVILVAMMPSLYWIVTDHHNWLWDQAWYGEVSVGLWFKLTQNLSEWWKAMMSAFGVKAPGIAWLGQFFVPLGRAIGSIETGLLWSMIATQFGSVALFHEFVKEILPGKRLVAAMGILLFASAPLFVGMSHQYLAEPLQLFGVTYVFFLAAKGHRMPRVTLLGHLLIAASIGLMAKSTSPIYCALPGVIAVRALFLKRKPENKASATGAVLGWLCVFVGLVLCWLSAMFYIAHFKDLRGYVKIAMDLDFTADYGRRGNFFQKLAIWLDALQFSFQLSWVVIGQLILFCAGLVAQRMRAGKRDASRADALNPGASRLNLFAIFSVVHICVVLSLCSLNYSEETRYLLPLLPAIATINIWLITRVRQTWVPAGVIALLVCQWIVVYAQSFGLAHLKKGTCSYWLYPLDADRKQAKEVARIVHQTANPVGGSRIHLVGVELPWLNANTVSFFAAKEELITGNRCYYTPLGYAAKDLDLAWKRMGELKVGYFISLEEKAQPDNPNFLNLISVAALRRIREDPDFVSEPFTSDLGVVLFRRKVGDPLPTSEKTAH